jgi:ferredoxin-NADP reductase
VKPAWHTVRVAAVVDETPDTRSFVIDVPAGLHEAFRYRAGQFCTVRVRLHGGDQLRCYSMSSAPEVDAALAVTVKRVPGGLVSNWLNDHVAANDWLEVTEPAGVFCLGESERPVVAFCGGSGVTPVISIAKSALAATDRPVRVLYANRDRGSVIFDAELRSLVARHPDRFAVRHHFDSDGGFLTPEAIAAFADDLDADFYVCGPGPFMDLVENTLLGRGVVPDRIAIERFTARPPGAAPATAVGDTEEVTLVLRGRKVTVAYQAGDTVLETARRAGVHPPFSCEAGNCATCMALVREGSATLRANNALTSDELDEGWILTCQALPSGRAVTVDYDAV